MTAEIHELPTATLENVAAVLRAIADEIDAGKYGRAVSAIVVLQADEFHAFGAGDANRYKGVYLLERGKTILMP